MILVAVRDLLFSSKIDAAARRVGAQVAWAPRGVPLAAAVAERSPRAILADLGEPGALDALRAARSAQPAVRIVGFVGHLRADVLDEARAMGVEEVLTRGQLAASLDDVLLRAAAGADEAGEAGARR
jgi:DNA-binding NarL/FixJ family response regulator